MDLNKLEELARAATPGPWLHRHDPGNPPGVQHGVKLEGEFGAWVCDCLDNADRLTVGGVAGERNAAFIAAANPAAVLDLIDLIRKQEARIDELTIVTGDQHMRLDAVLLVQAGLVTTLQEIRAQFDDGGPMQKFIDAKLTAAGVAL